PGALALHRWEEGEHLHGENRGRTGQGVEHGLAVGLPEGVRREVAAEVLGDVACDGMGGAAYPRVVAVATACQGACRGLATDAPCPTPETWVHLGGSLEFDQELQRPLGNRSVGVVRLDTLQQLEDDPVRVAEHAL